MQFQSTHPRGVRPSEILYRVRPLSISIHAPTWGATYRRTAPSSWPCYFNPRTHVGCDAANGPEVTISVAFQSTHPRGVRREVRSYPWFISDFNPRTHVGCDSLPGRCAHQWSRFQSTHPRGVRPKVKYPPDGVQRISIHAPTWGATVAGRIRQEVFGISIHAPTWGATCATLVLPVPASIFQSTHPRGVRPQPPVVVLVVGEISIHAPTWGATKRRAGKRQLNQDFNPRTHVGCDGLLILTGGNIMNFNPRTHVGCDAEQRDRHRQFPISIHAPTWGATNC